MEQQEECLEWGQYQDRQKKSISSLSESAPV